MAAVNLDSSRFMNWQFLPFGQRRKLIPVALEILDCAEELMVANFAWIENEQRGLEFARGRPYSLQLEDRLIDIWGLVNKANRLARHSDWLMEPDLHLSLGLLPTWLWDIPHPMMFKSLPERSDLFIKSIQRVPGFR